jgi:hypothetical protein
MMPPGGGGWICFNRRGRLQTGDAGGKMHSDCSISEHCAGAFIQSMISAKVRQGNGVTAGCDIPIFGMKHAHFLPNDTAKTNN